MAQQVQHLYEFGLFRLDAAKRLLWREGEAVQLTPKCFDILLALIESSGEVVSKDKLIERVWPDSFVEEGNLTYNISMLRKALGERAGQHQFIATIPGRGYQFIATVRSVQDTELSAQVDQRPQSNMAERLRGKKWLAAGGLAIAILVAVVLWRTGAIRLHSAYTKPALASVAVLPLRSVGDNPEEIRYLADGISEALITKLTQLPGLRVTPWMTSERYRESTKNLRELANEMGVESLVSGTVRKDGDRIGVTLALIDGRSGLQQWAGEFEERFADIFILQRKIAISTAEKLRGELTGQQEQLLAKAASTSAEAYEYYLRGKSALAKRSKEDSDLAHELFQKALKIDPNMAEAYAGIGNVQRNRYHFGWGGDLNALEEAEKNMLKALELNPQLIYAQLNLIDLYLRKGKSEECLKVAQQVGRAGIEDSERLSAQAVGYAYAGMFDQALALTQRAVDIDPADASAHAKTAEAYIMMGRFQEAINAWRAYFRKFDENWDLLLRHGISHHCVGDYENAKMIYDKSIQLNPAQWHAYILLGVLYKQTGEPEKARQTWMEGVKIIKRMLDSYPVNPILRCRLALYYGHLGDKKALLEEEARILSEEPNNGTSRYQIALAHAALGDTSGAVKLFREALHQGYLFFRDIKVLKAYGLERLYESPEYQDFLREYQQEVNRLREKYGIG